MSDTKKKSKYPEKKEEKKFTPEEIKQLRAKIEDKTYDLYADMLIKKIEECKTSNWEKPWFTPGCNVRPRSLYGKCYNGSNAFMLQLLCEKKGYKTPVFATAFRIFSLNHETDAAGNRVSAKDKDGNNLPFVHLLKGEKRNSFPVILSQVSVVKKDSFPKEKISWSDYVNLSEEERAKYSVYHYNRIYDVYNIDQTNLKEARPELYQKLYDQCHPKTPEVKGEDYVFEPLDYMVENKEWICDINIEYGDTSSYNIKTNVITLPEKHQFLIKDKAESYYGTMLHEMLHSTGAPGYLDRLKPMAFSSADYAKEELTVEMGAAILGNIYGFSKYIKDDSIPYIDSWLGSLREKPDFIRSLLKDVKMATSIVDTRVEYIRKTYLNEKESDKLDVREEDDTTLEFDESGDAHLSMTETHNVDSKQGDKEGKGRDGETLKEEERRRSAFHR